MDPSRNRTQKLQSCLKGVKKLTVYGLAVDSCTLTVGDRGILGDSNCSVLQIQTVTGVVGDVTVLLIIRTHY